MRMAGPKRRWHTLIRRNHGANHMIIGRGHESGSDSNGKPSMNLMRPRIGKALKTRSGWEDSAFGEFVYLPDEERYEDVAQNCSRTQSQHNFQEPRRVNGTATGINLPSWFAREEVASAIAETYLPNINKDFAFGSPDYAAGKSTTAEILTVLLQELGRQVTLLDGDAVRNHLSKGLGFKDDRDTNIRRMGLSPRRLSSTMVQ